MTYYNAEHYCDPTAGAAEQHINDQARVVGAARAGKGAMMQSVTFRVPGPPQGKARPRFRTVGGKVMPYTPASTRRYEEQIAAMYRRAGGLRLEPPIRVEVLAVFGVPKSYSKRRRSECLQNITPPEVKPDVDNISKSVLDALNKLAYGDDSKVSTLMVTKRYGAPEGLVIRVTGQAPATEEQLEEVGG
ncbi:RusA family crossover junction endodeoxyribonuclease [Allofournierella sp.]|uniref:RusA family crossover junction endodeoxyribonuclease n=1 Tax=Allofournierella sp. TaxID=1940256 RepID=UPI003AF1CFD5